ncbi:MAG: acyl-CoA dehydrogenase family protein [Rhodococcus sp. (in: high G+C Gram-positive bacteria)]
MRILDDDRQLLADSLRALLSSRSGPAAVRSAIASPNGYDASLWAILCDQIGVGGISIPDEYGGAGGGTVEAVVVAEELGRVLAPSPALGSGLAAALLLATDDENAKGSLLPAIASGRTIVAVCVANARAIWDAETAVEARDDRGWLLTGTAHHVLDAAVAEVFVVLARTPDGLGWFLVSASTGVTCTGGSAMDPTRALHRVRFDDAPARRIDVVDPRAALTSTIDTGMILLAGEQAGAAARCLELTVAYTKSRVQFGRPIGSFQALKHRMADLLVLVRTARALAYAAANSDERNRHTDATVARIHCSEAFETVAAECVQLHGGIAITWEHDMQLYFKRAHSSAHLFGTPRQLVRSLDEAAGVASHGAVSPT